MRFPLLTFIFFSSRCCMPRREEINRDILDFDENNREIKCTPSAIRGKVSGLHFNGLYQHLIYIWVLAEEWQRQYGSFSLNEWSATAKTTQRDMDKLGAGVLVHCSFVQWSAFWVAIQRIWPIVQECATILAGKETSHNNKSQLN